MRKAQEILLLDFFGRWDKHKVDRGWGLRLWHISCACDCSGSGGGVGGRAQWCECKLGFPSRGQTVKSGALNRKRRPGGGEICPWVNSSSLRLSPWEKKIYFISRHISEPPSSALAPLTRAIFDYPARKEAFLLLLFFFPCHRCGKNVLEPLFCYLPLTSAGSFVLALSPPSSLSTASKQLGVCL